MRAQSRLPVDARFTRLYIDPNANLCWARGVPENRVDSMAQNPEDVVVTIGVGFIQAGSVAEQRSARSRLITTESTGMKTSLITAAVITSALVLSATASAGGENCPSKGGVHKDLSATLSKDGKDHHGWVAAQDAAKAEESAVSGTDTKQEITTQPARSVLKI